MKKQLKLLIIFACISLASCTSTPSSNKTNDVQINYAEITLKDFKSTNLKELFTANKKYILIKDFSYEEAPYNKLDFSVINEKIPDWEIRSTNYYWESKKTNCIAKGKIINGTNGFGTDYYLQIEDLENLRTIDELESERQIILKRIATIRELSAKKIEELKKTANKKGASLAKGYKYHGYDEVERNIKLFKNKALEKGHAYYIPSFKLEGSFAVYEEWVTLNKKQTTTIYVSFLNQSIKAEYVDLEKTDFIITSGNISGSIIIGNIGIDTNSSIEHYQFPTTMNIDSNFKMDYWFTYQTIVDYEKELGITVKEENN